MPTAQAHVLCHWRCHTVKCVPSALSLAHDLSCKLARPRTPCLDAAHACLPPHTLCMPTPSVHTTVTLYSTRHCRSKSWPFTTTLQHHHPALTSIVYTALLRSARALLKLCSRCDSKRELLLERSRRERLSHNQTCDTTRTCNSKRTDTTPGCNTITIYATSPAIYHSPALPAPAESPLTSRFRSFAGAPSPLHPQATTACHTGPFDSLLHPLSPLLPPSALLSSRSPLLLPFCCLSAFLSCMLSPLRTMNCTRISSAPIPSPSWEETINVAV